VYIATLIGTVLVGTGVAREAYAATLFHAAEALGYSTLDSGTEGAVSLASDGQGVVVAVWHSDANLLGAGRDTDIFASRSLDGGRAWTEPALLNSYATSDSSMDSDLEPCIATDGAGTWVVVWDSSHNLNGTIGPDPDIFVARSTDNGATWSAAKPLNSTAGVDFFAGDQGARVASDGAGGWLAVWESGYDLGGTVGTDWDVLAARSTDGGITWSNAVLLNSNGAADSQTAYDLWPRIDAAAPGQWVAVWESLDSFDGALGADWDILYAFSTNGGETWSEALPVADEFLIDDANDLWPTVACDVLGRCVIAWASQLPLDRYGSDWDIMVVRSAEAGNVWTAPVALNSNAVGDWGDDGYPCVATDGFGTWTAVWESAGDIEGALGPDADVLYAQSVNAGETWTAASHLNNRAPVDTRDDVAPEICAASPGQWVAAWPTQDDLGMTIENDWDVVVAHSIEADMLVSTPNGGELWPVAATRAITWAADPAIVGDYVRIGLHDANRAFLGWLVRRTPNDGAYKWVVPAELRGASDLLIRIQSFDAPEIRDYGDAPFAVSAVPLTVTAPNGGEVWQTGRVQWITWDVAGELTGPYVRIGLHRGNRFERWLALRAPNAGVFEWLVNADLDPGDDYYVRVQSYYYRRVRDFSDAPFAVEAGPLLITAPARRAAWEIGSIQTITWRGPGAGDHVRIGLHRAGAFLGWINLRTPNDGTYDWLVPELSPGEGYRLRVQDYTNRDLRDFSHRFSILVPEEP